MQLWSAAGALLERDHGGLASSIHRAARGGFVGGARWMDVALSVCAGLPAVQPSSEQGASGSETLATGAAEGHSATETGATRSRAARTNVAPLPGTNFTRFGRLGLAKYGLALLGGTLVAGAALALTSAPFSAIETSLTDPLGAAWAAGLVITLVTAFVIAAFAVGFYAIESRLVYVFPLALNGSLRPLRDSNQMVAYGGATHAFATVLSIAARMVVGSPSSFARRWATGCLAVVLWYQQDCDDAARDDAARDGAARDASKTDTVLADRDAARIDAIPRPAGANAR